LGKIHYLHYEGVHADHVLEDGPAAECSFELYILLTFRHIITIMMMIMVVVRTGKHNTKELQKTAISGIARILEKVLM
jgi:hypothetical protein